MRKIIMSLLIGLALMIVPSMAATGHINGCTNTGAWNNCCTKTFNITAKPGYRIVDVIVNGVSKGAITSYTFGNLTSAQTLKVITEAIQEILYTVSFNSNGGTGTMEAETFTEGTAKNLTSNAFTRTGYTFKEWNTNSDGTGISYTDGVSYTATGDVTLYAQWMPVSYTISYNLDGGTVSGNPTTYTIEDTVTLVNPTKDGYNFTGWTGTGLTEATTSVTIAKGSTGDRTYTANWELANVAPTTPTVTLSSKTTNSFNVRAVSTDANGDSLIYSLYVDGSLKSTSASTQSGTATTFSVTGLGEYTSHTYYVTVSDGKLTTTGNTNSVSTYCSGKGCNGNISETTCSRCKGYGYNECSGSWKSVNNYSAKCPTCDEYNNGGTAWGKYTCSKCSKQLKVYLCSSCGNGYYAFGSSDFTVTEDVITVNSSFLKYHNGDCYSCKGNGTRYECSSCNNTFSSSNTSHCTHGKTSQHD